MRRQIIVRVAFVGALIAALGLTGCANRQLIDSALQRSMANNELLGKEQAKSSEALIKTLDTSRELVQQLGAILQSECTQMNQGAASYVQARKEAVAYKLKTQFDDSAYELLEQFTVRFNEKYTAPMETEAKRLGLELAALDSSALTNDLGRAVKVAEKKREMTGVALNVASANVTLRDRLLARITAERASFASEVDNRLAGIVAPSDDCGVVAKEFVAAGSALSAQSDAVQKHQAAVEGLYAVQQSNLDIVRAYTNRVSFYKLVLQGAQEGAADKVRSLSESAGKALAGADARLEALLARAESRITKGAVKFDTELDGAAHALQADLTSKIDRSRSSVRELLTGLTHTASTTQP